MNFTGVVSLEWTWMVVIRHTDLCTQQRRYLRRLSGLLPYSDSFKSFSLQGNAHHRFCRSAFAFSTASIVPDQVQGVNCACKSADLHSIGSGCKG